MYKKPHLELYGTFRELTQFGVTGAPDHLTVAGVTSGTPGNNVCPVRAIVTGPTTFVCASR